MTKDRAPRGIGLIGPDSDWHAINWRSIESKVRKLRQRIFRATQNGQWNKVRSLMKLMLRSYANLLLSVRKVTQENEGKKTPGIDNRVYLTAKSRVRLVNQLLELKAWRAQPAVRLYIPKPGGKSRPLGILTVKNRAAQAIVKNALEPSWEARFESHSYGFRPGRSAHDAIEQCWNRLKKVSKDRWVLDADIKGAFDNIDHDFILRKLGPTPARGLIKAWLKAGFVENETFLETQAGTQQGGVISPLLANIALDGLQEALPAKFGFIRYADDFVVTARSREDLISILPAIQVWLSARGLELNDEKTKIASILDGFNFLGFNIRHYSGKCLVKPQKEKAQKLVQSINEWLRRNRSVEPRVVIYHLNPILRGWALYYKYAVSSQIFQSVQNHIWKQIWRWCLRRHPAKSKAWVKNKYFCTCEGLDWTFFAKTPNGQTHYLFNIGKVKIQRHRKVIGSASPDDPVLRNYWAARRAGYHRRSAEPDSIASAVKSMLRA